MKTVFRLCLNSCAPICMIAAIFLYRSLALYLLIVKYFLLIRIFASVSSIKTDLKHLWLYTTMDVCDEEPVDVLQCTYRAGTAQTRSSSHTWWYQINTLTSSKSNPPPLPLWQDTSVVVFSGSKGFSVSLQQKWEKKPFKIVKDWRTRPGCILPLWENLNINYQIVW